MGTIAMKKKSEDDGGITPSRRKPIEGTARPSRTFLGKNRSVELTVLDAGFKGRFKGGGRHRLGGVRATGKPKGKADGGPGAMAIAAV